MCAWLGNNWRKDATRLAVGSASRRQGDYREVMAEGSWMLGKPTGKISGLRTETEYEAASLDDLAQQREVQVAEHGETRRLHERKVITPSSGRPYRRGSEVKTVTQWKRSNNER